MNKIQTINLIKGSLCSGCKFNVSCNNLGAKFNICSREKDIYIEKRMTCDFWQKSEGSKIIGTLEMEEWGPMVVAMDSDFLTENIDREMIYNFTIFDKENNKRDYTVKIKPEIQR